MGSLAALMVIFQVVSVITGQALNVPLNQQNTLIETPVQQPVQAAAPPAIIVDDACLACICFASTECKPLKCHVAGPSYFCGPYLISWAYWADAGKPSDNPTNPYAFETCLNDKACSEQTIRAYMAKNARDCDGDNRITCSDVARIHKAGPFGCSSPWVDNTTYWKTFLACSSGQPRFNADQLA